MASMSGRTHAEPFSTGRMRSVGNRVSRPCPISDATVSKMPRPCVCTMSMKADLPGEREVLPAGVALPLVVVAGEAVVGGVHADRDVELGHPLPEGVELGQRERAVALGSRAPGRAG